MWSGHFIHMRNPEHIFYGIIYEIMEDSYEKSITLLY